jgi:hypothetical protein
MRRRLLTPIFLILFVALASVGATAFAAAGGTSGDRGKSAAAHEAHGPSASQHDPSNPDGTYRGKSQSTPDQDGTGADHGIVNNDKTGPGTDGNNGCGNDADREDDNNGWCGRKPSSETPTPTPTVAPTVAPTQTSGGNGSEVLGETFTRPKKPATQVLGVSFARTGTAVLTLSLLAMTLTAMGFGLRAIAKPRRSN